VEEGARRIKGASGYGPVIVHTRAQIWLKPGRDKKMRSNYPWVQRGEILRIEGEAENGSLASLRDCKGEFLGVGTYNGLSRFPFRILTTSEEPIDRHYYAKRFREALAHRELTMPGITARRVVYAEADKVPGLIVDQYGDYLAVQVRTLGSDKLRDHWLPALIEVFKPKGIVERSEMESRREEGLDPYSGVIFGTVPEEVEIEEGGVRFSVPIKGGLKTGYYLDQRDTRERFASMIKPGDKVLDCFCYMGAFSLMAAKAGADVLSVDMNEMAITLADKNAQVNGLKVKFVQANAFDYLEFLAPKGAIYDWIILDPPAISKDASTKNSLKWAIWKLVHNALPLLKPGGMLIVCNCSYQFTLQDSIDTCRLAGSDRGRRLFLEGVTYQSPDHPAPIQFPESLYLKCIWLRGE